MPCQDKMQQQLFVIVRYESSLSVAAGFTRQLKVAVNVGSDFPTPCTAGAVAQLWRAGESTQRTRTWCTLGKYYSTRRDGAQWHAMACATASQ